MFNSMKSKKTELITNSNLDNMNAINLIQIDYNIFHYDFFVIKWRITLKINHDKTLFIIYQLILLEL